MTKAVVDVGSNSVLLLVERHEDGRWTPIEERTWVTSLGAGTRETGLLSELGMRRTLGALAEAFQIANTCGAESIQAAATMATRIARNTSEFLERASAQRTPVEVLSGDEEAQLGLDAVAYDNTFADDPRLSVIDVGGQSTELVTAERNEQGLRTLFRKSFALGTLALRGGVLRPECPGPAEILQAVVEIDETIGLCYRKGMCGYPITLGATGTNLVSIRERLAEWQPDLVHGSWLGYEEISNQATRLMAIPEAERRNLIGIESGREGTLPAGALILERFLFAIGAPGCAVSVRGWRHALLERGLN